MDQNASPPFEYEKTNHYYAQVPPGLEDLAEQELGTLGATRLNKGHRGVAFNADKAALYRIAYQSRFCGRLLAPLFRFDCHSGKYLTLTATRLDWERVIAKDQTFAVSANINASKIRHSHYAALCLKDAVADHFTARYGKRPNVDKREPDVRLHLHIDSNRAIIYLDISGGALHKRGYRKETVDAPMQETIAAAIIAMSGWQGECPLIDPMCGSGTLLIEAMMHYCRIPAGILRTSFGLSGMPDFDAALWASVKKRASETIRPLPAGLIFGSDKDPQAIKSARTNAGLFEQGKNITIRQQTLLEATQSTPSIIVCNPPYGLRLQKGMNIQEFMNEFGSTLKHRFTGSTAYLFLGRRELVKMVGLKPAWKKELATGGLDGLLAKYELY